MSEREQHIVLGCDDELIITTPRKIVPARFEWLGSFPTKERAERYVEMLRGTCGRDAENGREVKTNGDRMCCGRPVCPAHDRCNLSHTGSSDDPTCTGMRAGASKRSDAQPGGSDLNERWNEAAAGSVARDERVPKRSDAPATGSDTSSSDVNVLVCRDPDCQLCQQK